ncbi:hypothetical protein KIPB_004335 [Kipferlia bialata]|uniref:Uncharacterized protein n=1 Tax=Kipferlia bialata TaxID=797122 RepID=A0A9K3CVV4_9EUKA|nr:hypothetical protein KIPB_004335 [Kipferlia bialata]|eukprot:g4335.t1
MILNYVDPTWTYQGVSTNIDQQGGADGVSTPGTSSNYDNLRRHRRCRLCCRDDTLAEGDSPFDSAPIPDVDTYTEPTHIADTIAWAEDTDREREREALDEGAGDGVVPPPMSHWTNGTVEVSIHLHSPPYASRDPNSGSLSVLIELHHLETHRTSYLLLPSDAPLGVWHGWLDSLRDGWVQQGREARCILLKLPHHGSLWSWDTLSLGKALSGGGLFKHSLPSILVTGNVGPGRTGLDSVEGQTNLVEVLVQVGRGGMGQVKTEDQWAVKADGEREAEPEATPPPPRAPVCTVVLQSPSLPRYSSDGLHPGASEGGLATFPLSPDSPIDIVCPSTSMPATIVAQVGWDPSSVGPDSGGSVSDQGDYTLSISQRLRDPLDTVPLSTHASAEEGAVVIVKKEPGAAVVSPRPAPLDIDPVPSSSHHPPPIPPPLCLSPVRRAPDGHLCVSPLAVGVPSEPVPHNAPEPVNLLEEGSPTENCPGTPATPSVQPMSGCEGQGVTLNAGGGVYIPSPPPQFHPTVPPSPDADRDGIDTHSSGHSPNVTEPIVDADQGGVIHGLAALIARVRGISLDDPRERGEDGGDPPTGSPVPQPVSPGPSVPGMVGRIPPLSLRPDCIHNAILSYNSAQPKGKYRSRYCPVCYGKGHVTSLSVACHGSGGRNVYRLSETILDMAR